VLIENPPLCNGETQEYKQFLNQLLQLRTQAMSLLTQPLHQFYQSRKVVSIYWYEPSNDHPLQHNVLPSVHDTLNAWNVLEGGLEEERKSQKVVNELLEIRVSISVVWIAVICAGYELCVLSFFLFLP